MFSASICNPCKCCLRRLGEPTVQGTSSPKRAGPPSQELASLNQPFVLPSISPTPSPIPTPNPSPNSKVIRKVLLHAINNHNLSKVSALLHNNVDINFIQDEKSPLSHAIDAQHKLCPLHEAPSESVVKALLEAKASLQCGLPLLTAMQIEPEQRIMQIARWLLDASNQRQEPREPLLEQRDQYGQTSLVWAVAKKNSHVVEFLLQNKADVNGCDHHKNTPLLHAIKLKAPRVILSLLLLAGADVNVVSLRGRYALHYARRFQDSALYYTLIAFGARLDSIEKTVFSMSSLSPQAGERCLVDAIEKNHLMGVYNLLKFGVSANKARR